MKNFSIALLLLVSSIAHAQDITVVEKCSLVGTIALGMVNERVSGTTIDQEKEHLLNLAVKHNTSAETLNFVYALADAIWDADISTMDKQKETLAHIFDTCVTHNMEVNRENTNSHNGDATK